MHYEGNIIRPPSEANSILMQVTVGCSHNKCTFCGTYKGQRFKFKATDTIKDDISFAKRYCKAQKRLFLCDGDALIMPQAKLLEILTSIETSLPWVERVGIYANSKSLKRKSLEELRELKEHGLGIVYMGLESGDNQTLINISKKSDAETMIAQACKVREAGIKLSITVILGIAGSQRSNIHARETGRVLSAIDPDYVGALSLMLIPGTPLHNDWESGEFTLLNSIEMLKELRMMIQYSDLSKGFFTANHASNYLPIKAHLPEEKEKVLKLIDKALDGNIPLKPEWLRAL